MPVPSRRLPILPSPPEVRLGEIRVGLQKTSLVDYPGTVAATIFLAGCNLRCPWCHNGDLVTGSGQDPASGLVRLDDALALIARRRPVLGGVAITGGEPLLTPALAAIIERIKSLGLPVKLDTNGTLPHRLEALLASSATRPDYVAVDLKLAPGRYRELLPPGPGPTIDPGDALAASARLLGGHSTAHEFRTLVFADTTVTADDIRELAPLVDGDTPWYFSAFKPGTCLDPGWNARPGATRAQVQKIAALALQAGKNGKIRGW